MKVTLTKILKSFNSLDDNDKKKEFEEEKKPVDIGFPTNRLSRSVETKLRLEHREKLKKDSEMEKKARLLKCNN